MSPTPIRLTILAAVWLCCRSPEAGVKIYTSTPGAYQVTFEELAPALGTTDEIASSGLSLYNLGEPVAIWVEDGGDGSFGPGDRFEFVATILTGEHSYHHEYSNHNVYVLKLAGDEPRRMQPVSGSIRPAASPSDAGYIGHRRVEVDQLLMRFSGAPDEQELWYWHKFAPTDDEPFVHEIDLADLDIDSGTPVTLGLKLRGWSQLRRSRHDPDPVPDHLLEVLINDKLVSRETWDGKTDHEVELAIDLAHFRAGSNRLELRTARRNDAEGRMIVDVSLLNAFEIRYPKSARLGAGRQERFVLTERRESWTLTTSSTAGNWRIFAGDDLRVVFPATDGATGLTVPVGARVGSLLAADETAIFSPAGIAPLHDGDLASATRQADYILITHPSLEEAVEPLAQYREAGGLSVARVAIDEIYDQFNHGVRDPRAIRDFLAHAYHEWQRPAPRFVLLVGDASWDFKNDDVEIGRYAFKPIPLQNLGVGRTEGIAYENVDGNTRGLIPTWNYVGGSGHSASDNYFVSVDGDEGDYQPDMAIGRFAVTAPAEVTAIVDKIVAYEARPNVGPWRNRALFITNEQPVFQHISDQIVDDALDAGIAPRRIYPAHGEAGSTERILSAIDEGQYFVYFYGHGGRFIWRTSPRDLTQTRDLFSLDDLDRLQPNDKLPVVLSFTCYSAPFDHPSEDSIGEKFVRLADRGAVAFVGASWRNNPDRRLQSAFVRAFSTSTTAGEAMIAAKSELDRRDVVETYNLLGDPALALRLPPRAIELEYNVDRDRATVRGTILDDELRGPAVLELIDADGVVMHHTEFQADGVHFSVALSEVVLQAPAQVVVYVWNEETGRNGVGRLAVEPEQIAEEHRAQPEG